MKWGQDTWSGAEPQMGGGAGGGGGYISSAYQCLHLLVKYNYVHYNNNLLANEMINWNIYSYIHIYYVLNMVKMFMVKISFLNLVNPNGLRPHLKKKTRVNRII